METNYGVLISEIPTNLKNKLRKYERCLKKINTTIWSVEFIYFNSLLYPMVFMAILDSSSLIEL